VVFDLGGVLLDWNPRHLYRKVFAGDEEGMERFLATVCTSEWNLELDRGRSFEEAVAELQAAHPDHHEQIGAYRERWIEMIGGPIEGTVAIVEELHRAGVPLYALSNIHGESFLKARERFPFMQHFRGALVSGDERIIKPDPEIFRLLAQRFGLVPERTVFVDDVPANASGAASVGFHAHAFTTPEALRKDLIALGLPL
jgi:2-haloacid dehalogenase